MPLLKIFKKIWHKYTRECVIVGIMCFVYIVLHISVIRFGDSRVLFFILRPFSTFLSNEPHDGILLGYAELETPLGKVRMKPFCTFRSSTMGYVSYIGVHNFISKKAEHDLIVVGTPVIPSISISFGLINNIYSQ